MVIHTWQALRLQHLLSAKVSILQSLSQTIANDCCKKLQNIVCRLYHCPQNATNYFKMRAAYPVGKPENISPVPVDKLCRTLS